MNVKFEVSRIAVAATPDGQSPQAALTAIVEAVAEIADRAGCGEELAAVMAGEAAMLRATPREISVAGLAVLAHKAAKDAREGGEK